LYGIDGTGVLYSIDPTSDAVTLVGSLGLGLSGTIGLSTGSGSLYFTQGGYLYQIDTSTGAASLIGPTGIGDIGGLVYADGTLYGGQDSSPVSIATLDPTSGAGSSGPLVTNSQGGPLGLAQLPDGGVRQFDDIAVVPEPSFVGALGLGLLATGWFAYRRHKRTA